VHRDGFGFGSHFSYSRNQISGRAPTNVPPGDHCGLFHLAKIECHLDVVDLQIDDAPWDGQISLRRPDMYDYTG
jgi:hypothetical protein